MSAIQEVLRYLHARVPAGTQEEHDKVAALIDTVDEPSGATSPAPDGPMLPAHSPAMPSAEQNKES